MLMVLFGALLHASWNAMVKSGGDKLREAGLVVGGAAAVSLVLLPFVPLPDAACWPWLVGSIVVHQIYYGLVAAAYRAGDMSHTYPLMRGTAPLLVAVSSAALIGEQLSPATMIGVACICGGILLLAFHRHVDRAATGLALANALVIAVYTFVDGIGARVSGHAVSYVLWLTFLTAPGFIGYLLWRDAGAMRTLATQRTAVALGGGACSVGSYGFALWAMTMAPLAAVAALRETSVLFGVVIATFVLRERGTMQRVGAAVAIVAGAAALKLA